MRKDIQKFFIIDFDSTFVTTEALEELAQIALVKNRQKEKIIQKIKVITNLGMEGKIGFSKSLRQRLKLISINQSHLKKLIKLLKKKISPSIKNNKKFFKKYHKNIYIISGGFKEFIQPVVASFGISDNHILANSFIFNQKGEVIGYDKKNPLAQKNGKVKIVKSLQLKGEIFVIGDGYTDYQIKAMGVAKHFTAFTENAKREIVIKNADQIVQNFDEFLYINRLPASVSYPKSKIKVLLLENIHNTAIESFKQEGYQVEYYKKSFSFNNLAEKIKNVSILGIRSRTNVTDLLLRHVPRLISIGVYAIGTNQIDLPACTRQGTAIFNAPYSNTRSVVELVIGEIIMLMRGIFNKSNKLHQGIWEKSAVGAYEIRRKKLGIIGYGNIGSQLSVLAEELGMEVYFYDVVDKLSLGNANKCRSIKELLKKCDVITVHVDGNVQNKNLISEKEFKLMKKGVIFLNLSRGYVVDIKSLKKYLKNGQIKGAGIDVFPKEPKDNKEPFISELQHLPNVILTPHIGGSTQEAQYNIGEFVTTKIINYINNGDTEMSVNLPNIRQVKAKNSHRLLHLHKNVPGILSQINTILANNHINILSQYLKTNDQVGYVITDVNKKYDQRVIKELKNIPQSIRFRLLY